jgi:hypothetical protein
MTDEKPPTPEEQREAEALRRALEGETADAPADALETAALLGASRSAELSDLRARAVREKVLPQKRVWHWMAPLAAAGAAAAIVIVMFVARRQVPTALPAPSAALLAAQAESARPKGAEGVQLDREMVAYRARVLGALEGRYR